MTSLQNKNILITGAASGIGRLIAGLAVKEKAKNLILLDINQEKLIETKEELSQMGLEPLIFSLDISNNEVLFSCLEKVEKQVGSIDILFNNAGIVIGKTFEKHNHSDIDKTLAINTSALMHLSLKCLKGMIKNKGGHIINMSSAASMVATPSMSVYCASKWAVSGWSDSLRLELQREHPYIKVTTVTPYYISTGMFNGVKSPFIPILDPNYVAKKLVDAVKKNKVFLRMPRILYFLPLIKGLLPRFAFDFLMGDLLKIYKTMDTFKKLPD